MTSLDYSDDSVLEECFNHVLDLTNRAGVIVKEAIDGVKNVEIKTDFYDLVTEYDSRVENILMAGILSKYPDHKFIAEETAAKTDVEDVLTNDPTWIIDPIDGTTSFIHGFPLICISIALVVKKEIVIGICYNPVANEMYTARKNKGAFLNGKPMRVSKIKKIEDSLIAVETSLACVERGRNHIMTRVYALASRSSGIRTIGSAALTLCYVARGIIDAYQIDFLKPWDIAAGALLIQEAGGIVRHSNGGEYDIMNPDVIVSGTQEMFDEVLRISKECNNQIIEVKPK